jgi:hypothetical protein
MTSKIEQLIRKTLNCAFPKDKVIYNWRPDFLKNPLTGRNLELDIYYPELNLAFEINGVYHLTICGKTRDSFKKKKCEEEHINLFAITNPKEIIKIIEQLKLFYPEIVPLSLESIIEINKYCKRKNKDIERLKNRFTMVNKKTKKKKFKKKFRKIF